MSWRRSLSFDSDEDELLIEFDSNGKSKFAKEAMKFFIKFKDRVAIVPDGLSLNHRPKVVNSEHKKTIKSLIK